MSEVLFLHFQRYSYNYNTDIQTKDNNNKRLKYKINPFTQKTITVDDNMFMDVVESYYFSFYEDANKFVYILKYTQDYNS